MVAGRKTGEATVKGKTIKSALGEPLLSRETWGIENGELITLEISQSRRFFDHLYPFLVCTKPLVIHSLCYIFFLSPRSSDQYYYY